MAILKRIILRLYTDNIIKGLKYIRKIEVQQLQQDAQTCRLNT